MCSAVTRKVYEGFLHLPKFKSARTDRDSSHCSTGLGSTVDVCQLNGELALDFKCFLHHWQSSTAILYCYHLQCWYGMVQYLCLLQSGLGQKERKHLVTKTLERINLVCVSVVTCIVTDRLKCHFIMLCLFCLAIPYVPQLHNF